MSRIDLNCDLGEGAGHDAELMPLITSASIACGGHAGDAATMRATMALARRHGVRVGAHPGFVDRAHFGRRELALPLPEIRQLVIRQVAALREIGVIHHVKPHGGLYNLAAHDRGVAETIAAAVRAIDPALVLVGLAGSELVRAGRAAGLAVAEEVFADRTYQPDGSLTPRDRAGAGVENERLMVQRVLRMIEQRRIRAVDGTDLPVTADTVCLHGDGPQAVAFATVLRRELLAAGVEIRAW